MSKKMCQFDMRNDCANNNSKYKALRIKYLLFTVDPKTYF